MRRHAAQDHVPFKRGCPVCLAAQGRQRSHWRSAVTGVCSISVDIAGPFKPGQGWDPGASGRDKGWGYKYFLASAFTIPLEPKTSVEATEDQRLQAPQVSEPVPADLDLPDMAELFGEEPELYALEGGSVPAVKVVEHRFLEKAPEPEGPVRVDTLPAAAEPPLPPPKEEPPAVSTRTLFMAMPLRSRAGKEVMLAVQALISRLESAGFPVHRYHADRAKELRSMALVQWLRDKAIHARWTAGESPAGNKAELAVQNIKGSARKILYAQPSLMLSGPSLSFMLAIVTGVSCVGPLACQSCPCLRLASSCRLVSA